MNSWITDSDAQELVVGFRIPLLLTFRVMSVGELDQAVDEQLNFDADTEDDTNAIPDAEAYH